VDTLVCVEANYSETEVVITPASSFFIESLGVPAWIGVEYMGQTAATIAGYQLEAGTLEPHVGLLLGTRKYTCKRQWFAPGAVLRIRCEELSVMQGTVATFQCEIRQHDQLGTNNEIVAQANLTVYRTTIPGSSA